MHHSDKDHHYQKKHQFHHASCSSSSLPDSHPGSRHPSIGSIHDSTNAANILVLAKYLQQQQQAQLPIDLTQTPPGESVNNNNHHLLFQTRSNHHQHHQQQQHFNQNHQFLNHNLNQYHLQQQPQPETITVDGTMLFGSMLNHYQHHQQQQNSLQQTQQQQQQSNSALSSPPESPINNNNNLTTGSGTMSPTKKLSKPLIEKRRRDRINRCLRLLKELVIDSKRFPLPNVSSQ